MRDVSLYRLDIDCIKKKIIISKKITQEKKIKKSEYLGVILNVSQKSFACVQIEIQNSNQFC